MAQFTKAQIIEALHASKGLVNIAATKLGCSTQTIYNWINKSPDVKAVLEEEREAFIDKAELGLMAAVSKQEAWAITLALKTVGKRRGYVERSEQVNYNVDAELLKKTIDAIELAGLSAADVFNNILAEIDSAHVSATGADKDTER